MTNNFISIFNHYIQFSINIFIISQKRVFKPLFSFNFLNSFLHFVADAASTPFIDNTTSVCCFSIKFFFLPMSGPISRVPTEQLQLLLFFTSMALFSSSSLLLMLMCCGKKKRSSPVSKASHRQRIATNQGNSTQPATPSTRNSPPVVSTNPAGQAPDMQMEKSGGPWVRGEDNGTYIVAGIALRGGADGQPLEVLLVQESKKECRGKWYIPAGHVEMGETMEEAVKREFREETGLECEPEALISREVLGSSWHRLSFAVRPTGGELKTKADKESMAAGWHSLALLRQEPCPLPLRCRDFLKIIDRAAERYASGEAATVPRPPHLCDVQDDGQEQGGQQPGTSNQQQPTTSSGNGGGAEEVATRTKDNSNLTTTTTAITATDEGRR